MGCFTQERPRQSLLGQQVPTAHYRPSLRPYAGLPLLGYPFHDWTATVTHCGRVCYRGRKIHLSHALAGQAFGVRKVKDHLWLVTFMHYDLGYFDDETCRLEPIAYPFGSAVSPMSSE